MKPTGKPERWRYLPSHQRRRSFTTFLNLRRYGRRRAEELAHTTAAKLRAYGWHTSVTFRPASSGLTPGYQVRWYAVRRPRPRLRCRGHTERGGERVSCGQPYGHSGKHVRGLVRW